MNSVLEILTSSIEALTRDFIAHLPHLATALLILAATWVAARVGRWAVEDALERFDIRDSLAELFRKMTVIGIWLGGFLLAAMVLFPDLTPAKLLAAVGLGSVAVGFAFKDTFENFLAGVLILWREPFKLGDFIESGGLEGKVEAINIRDTHIRQTDGQRVVLPNGFLFKNPVTVRTDLPVRRVRAACGIGYGEDVEQAREIIERAIRTCESVETDRPIQVYVKEFGSSSVDFDLTWWTESAPGDIRRSRDKALSAVKKALDEAGIEIPFPYRTLTFSEPLKARIPALTEAVEAIQ